MGLYVKTPHLGVTEKIVEKSLTVSINTSREASILPNGAPLMWKFEHVPTAVPDDNGLTHAFKTVLTYSLSDLGVDSESWNVKYESGGTTLESSETVRLTTASQPHVDISGNKSYPASATINFTKGEIIGVSVESPRTASATFNGNTIYVSYSGIKANTTVTVSINVSYTVSMVPDASWEYTSRSWILFGEEHYNAEVVAGNSDDEVIVNIYYPYKDEFVGASIGVNGKLIVNCISDGLVDTYINLSEIAINGSEKAYSNNLLTRLSDYIIKAIPATSTSDDVTNFELLDYNKMISELGHDFVDKWGNGNTPISTGIHKLDDVGKAEEIVTVTTDHADLPGISYSGSTSFTFIEGDILSVRVITGELPGGKSKATASFNGSTGDIYIHVTSDKNESYECKVIIDYFITKLPELLLAPNVSRAGIQGYQLPLPNIMDSQDSPLNWIDGEHESSDGSVWGPVVINSGDTYYDIWYDEGRSVLGTYSTKEIHKVINYSKVVFITACGAGGHGAATFNGTVGYKTYLCSGGGGGGAATLIAAIDLSLVKYISFNVAKYNASNNSSINSTIISFHNNDGTSEDLKISGGNNSYKVDTDIAIRSIGGRGGSIISSNVSKFSCIIKYEIINGGNGGHGITYESTEIPRGALLNSDYEVKFYNDSEYGPYNGSGTDKGNEYSNGDINIGKPYELLGVQNEIISTAYIGIGGAVNASSVDTWFYIYGGGPGGCMLGTFDNTKWNTDSNCKGSQGYGRGGRGGSIIGQFASTPSLYYTPYTDETDINGLPGIVMIS